MHKLNDAWHHLGCRAKNISGGRNATIRDCLVLQQGIESYSIRKLYETPSNYSYKQTYYIVHIDNVLTYYNCSWTRPIIRMRTPSLFFSFLRFAITVAINNLSTGSPLQLMRHFSGKYFQTYHKQNIYPVFLSKFVSLSNFLWLLGWPDRPDCVLSVNWTFSRWDVCDVWRLDDLGANKWHNVQCSVMKFQQWKCYNRQPARL